MKGRVGGKRGRWREGEGEGKMVGGEAAGREGVGGGNVQLCELDLLSQVWSCDLFFPVPQPTVNSVRLRYWEEQIT